MERFSHERIIHEDAPTPDQLHKLASIGVSSAASRQKLRKMNNDKRAHYFIEEIDFLSDVDMSAERSFPQEIRHRMAGRVGLKVLDNYQKEWSLNYFDTYWVSSESAGWLASRALYRFKWNKDQTVLAERTIRYIDGNGSVAQKDISDYIDNFRIQDYEASYWQIQEEFKKITAEDCEDLIESAVEYFNLIKMQNY